MDLVIEIGRLPRPGETITGGDLAFYPGGKGANQACAAARLGGTTVLVARVGNDPFGAKLLESLTASGVDTSGVGISPCSTGCASIYVLPDGQNSIVISPGANQTLDANALSGLRSLRAGDLLLCQLEVPIATVRAALAQAKAAGATTILDPAPARPLPQDLLMNVDILTPNQTEAAVLTGRSGSRPDDERAAGQIARELLSLGARHVILKLGKLGCYVAGRDVQAAVPGFEVDSLDSTAAGDVFNGALAVALAELMPLTDAARFANAAAAISVTRRGAQSSIPCRGEVEQFLRERGFGGILVPARKQEWECSSSETRD